MKFTIFFICSSLFLSVGASELKPLFTTERTLPMAAKAAGGAKITRSEFNQLELDIPSGTGWPQIEIKYPQKIDKSLSALKFKAVFSGSVKNGWVLDLSKNRKAVAGGYLHTSVPDRDGFYRIDLSGVPAGTEIDALRILFKNPAENIKATFSDFHFEFNPLAEKNNLAFGKKVSFETSPDYPHTTEPNDENDLTDGKVNTVDKIWMNRGTVGFRSYSMPSFTIDLGELRNLDLLRLHTGAGIAGVYWPLAIYVFASENGENYHLVGEMIQSNRDNLPEYNTGLFNLWLTSPLDICARYLKIAIRCNGMFAFIDEVEIYEKNGEGRNLADFPEFKNENGAVTEQFPLFNRLFEDLAILRANAEKFAIPVPNTVKLQKKYTSDFAQYLSLQSPSAPINLAQKELLLENLALLNAKNINRPIAWQSHRYDPFHLFMLPASDATQNTALAVRLAGREKRLETINFTNGNHKLSTIKIPTIPGIVFQEVLTLDTSNNFLNANLLRDVIDNTIILQPGESKQLAMTVDAESFQIGENNIILDFEEIKIPLKITRSNISLPKDFQTELGGFDYINNLPSHYGGIQSQNFSDVQKHLQNDRIDVIWGTLTVAPKILQEDFSSDDKLQKKLSSENFENWINRFPTARGYAIFMNASDQFAGVDRTKDPKRFADRLSAYLTAWIQVCLDLGIDPGKIQLHLVDEAGNEALKQRFNDWSTVIQQTSIDGKRFKTYFNPRIAANDSRTYDNADILVVSFDPDMKIQHLIELAAKRKSGSEFKFYRCIGGSRELDPFGYYMLPILSGILLENFGGFEFWSLDSGLPESLNEYAWNKAIYSPWYRNGDQFFSSKQAAAMLEARYFYEYVSLLKQKSPKHPILDELRQELLQEISTRKPDSIRWTTPQRRNITDRYRDKILDVLENK